jgi:signal transduction histidine kinase
MRRAVHRATDLVKRILTFSRPETHEQEPVQLGPVVLEAVHLLRSLIPAGIELSHHVEPDLPDVLANASQVHQVIVNLATNAWQAMDGGPGRNPVPIVGAGQAQFGHSGPAGRAAGRNRLPSRYRRALRAR